MRPRLPQAQQWPRVRLLSIPVSVPVPVPASSTLPLHIPSGGLTARARQSLRLQPLHRAAFACHRCPALARGFVEEVLLELRGTQRWRRRKANRRKPAHRRLQACAPSPWTSSSELSPHARIPCGLTILRSPLSVLRLRLCGPLSFPRERTKDPVGPLTTRRRVPASRQERRATISIQGFCSHPQHDEAPSASAARTAGRRCQPQKSVHSAGCDWARCSLRWRRGARSWG